ncbi:MAG: carbohydrate ABC transporter permease [Bacilli bacterium]|nr:carbohydrate ABC transporter permease [Bacilli bacterium]
MRKNVLKGIEHKKRKETSVFSIIIVALLLLYCLTLVILFSWAIIASFKNPLLDFEINKVGLPKEWIFDNYLTAYNEFYVEAPVSDGTTAIFGMPMLFLYGFLYAFGCAFAATLIPCLVGYVTAKFQFKFSKLIYLIVIVTMIVPIVGNLPAEIAMAKSLNLYDQIWGMWIMKANFLGIYFIVFYNFFRSQPDAYIEAAKIDGSSNFRTMVQIMLPMAMPLFFTVMLINFISFWNDYQVPLIYLPGHPTIAVAMATIKDSAYPQSMRNIPSKIAAAMLMLVPVLVLFLAFHKKLLGNLTMGGIKG